MHIFFQDEAAKDSLVRNLKNTSTASSKLLLAAKSLVSDPNAPNAKNSLANAARLVTWNPLALLSVCFFKTMLQIIKDTCSLYF